MSKDFTFFANNVSQKSRKPENNPPKMRFRKAFSKNTQG
jgi:hypothetical protein